MPNTLVDTGDFNYSVFLHFLVESIPGIIIQAINNTLLGQWTGLAIFSMVCSGFMILNGLYAFVYYRYMKGRRVPVWQIPVDQTIRIKAPLLGIDRTIVEAKLIPAKTGMI